MPIDAARLKELVGGPLAEGLIHVATNQPADHVDCLGKWLLNWAKMQEDAEIQAVKQKAAEEAYNLRQQQLKLDDEKKSAQEAMLAVEQSRRDDLSQYLESSLDLEEMQKKVIAQLGADLGAACYIGLIGNGTDEEGNATAEKSCEYVLADAKNEFMVHQTLDANEGITWDVYKIPEVEEPEVDEDGNPMPVPAPEYLHIPNVLREYSVDPETGEKGDLKMKFFNYPQLGSYLCVPCNYGSSLHADAPESPPEAEVDEDGNAGEVPSITKPKELLICLDTVGLAKGTPFSDEQIAQAVNLSKRLSAGLARAEAQLYLDDCKHRAEAAEENAKMLEELAAAGGGQDIEAELEKQKEAGLSEDELKALEAQLRINAANKQVLTLKQKFAELERYRVPPKQEAMDVLQGVLFLLKYTKKDLGGKATDWQKMRRLFDNEFFAKVENWDPKAKAKASPYQKVAAVKGMLEGKDLESLNKLSVVYGALWTWGMAAVTAKEVEIAAREAAEVDK